MFRVRRASNPAVLWTTLSTLVVLLGATGATIWLAMEVRKEQRAIREILQGGVVEDIQRLGTLPAEVRWQFLFTVLVFVVLIVTASVLVLVMRAYLTNLASLREVESLAVNILASMEQGVVTTDAEGRITSVNPRSRELLGIDFACIGRSIDDIPQIREPLAEASRSVLQTGRPQYDCDFSVVRNGHSVLLRADGHVLKGVHDTLSGSVFHIRDVTERRLIEDRLRRMERFLGLGSLAAGLHHEIKNPLSALSLHVQLLEERLEGQADDDIQETLSILKTEVTRISGVLESFRGYASLDTLHRTDTDLVALVKQTVELIKPKANQQGVAILVEIPEGNLPSVLLDATRVEQVLLNLVMNALDEMPEGGTLSLKVSFGKGKIAISVTDTGRGIPDNVRERIFDPYFTTKRDGSGMGLAICDKIVRQHDGQIDVTSSPSGATFRVSFPAENHLNG